VVHVSGADCEKLWELSAGGLLEALRRRVRSRDESLVVGSFLYGLLVCSIMHSHAMAGAWKELWTRDNYCPFMRRQLALVGSYVGDSTPHLDWLMDDKNRDLEMAYALCFVRRDLADDLLDCESAYIRDVCRSAERSPAVRTAVAPLNLLAGHIRACMRDPHHFQNAGHALMLLLWADTLAARLQDLARSGRQPDELAKLAEELERLERVQHLEKNRFFRICERSQRPVSERLMQLWSRSYTRRQTPSATR
jgi:hypothetical protein